MEQDKDKDLMWRTKPEKKISRCEFHILRLHESKSTNNLKQVITDFQLFPNGKLKIWTKNCHHTGHFQGLYLKDQEKNQDLGTKKQDETITCANEKLVRTTTNIITRLTISTSLEHTSSFSTDSSFDVVSTEHWLFQFQTVHCEERHTERL